ncbi:hypothetical protein TEHAL1_22730 [Tetragenococcus halophilus]|nr:hypothetical protein TEHAL1_22730 [Tetragenococcus halophilus]
MLEIRCIRERFFGKISFIVWDENMCISNRELTQSARRRSSRMNFFLTPITL